MPISNSLLVLRRHRERTHDYGEDEEVVHRQGLLGDVAGEVLAAEFAAPLPPDEHAEHHRNGDVDRRPDRRFPQGGFVCDPNVCEEVEDEESQDHHAGDDPHLHGYVHDAIIQMVRSCQEAKGVVGWTRA